PPVGLARRNGAVHADVLPPRWGPAPLYKHAAHTSRCALGISVAAGLRAWKAVWVNGQVNATPGCARAHHQVSGCLPNMTCPATLARDAVGTLTRSEEHV